MSASPLLAAVRSALDARRPQDETWVVGLSGGADSVALLHALASQAPRRRLRLVAAHLDHGLRPDSEEDRVFCEALCRELGVPLRSERSDVAGRAARDGEGIEAAARRERYAFLRRVAAESGADAVAVAHTRDDQAETVLLRLLRGAGRTGLGGMRALRGDLVRPLLEVSRAEVLDYLEARGLSWREDPTNADPGFARNRVRHELIPYLETHFNPRLREALAATAATLAAEADYLDERADALIADARPDAAGLRAALGPLRDAPQAVARRALRRLAERAGSRLQRVQVERLLRLARSPRPSGRRLPLPQGRTAHFRPGALWIGPEGPAAPYALELAVPGEVRLPDGATLLARVGPTDEPSEAAVVRVGAALQVRTRRPGDRARRRGREISLKRLLLDRRVPADRRDALPLVADGPRVLWGPGLEIDAPPPQRGERLIRLALSPAALTPRG